MPQIKSMQELQAHVSKEIGTSEWVLIDQALINRFADVTRDHYWVHVDVDRAAKEMPGGKTIAHSLLMQSLVPGLSVHMMAPGSHRSALSYGSDRVRYPAVAGVGDRVRLHCKLTKAEKVEQGVMTTRSYTMEIEGKSRPAMVADVLTLFFAVKGAEQ